MKLWIQDKSYLVLQTMEAGPGGLCQYLCRLQGEEGGREYKAVRIPSAMVTPELIRYLMEQTRKESFHEFVNYATDAEAVTVLMDCGRGITLEEKEAQERLSLQERLELARGLVSHLVLADFPPYFIHSAMDRRRIRVNGAMDFSFSFELSDLLSFATVDFSAACIQLGTVLGELFEKERKERSIPELDSLLYRLSHGELSELLSVYEELEGIYRLLSEKEEETLENRSMPFLLWERIKWAGGKLKGLIKLGILLLALFYLGLSIYQFVQPEKQGTVYTSIGNLEIRE